MHSEETLRQKKQDKLQHHVDQHEGKLLNNLQRLHTLKHVNELIPPKTLTADINIRLQDESATDNSVMTFVAVGILIGHLLAILTIIRTLTMIDTNLLMLTTMDINKKRQMKELTDPFPTTP